MSNTTMISRIVGPLALGLWLGASAPACTVAEGNDDDGGTEAPTCEHGMTYDCACTDGSMGTQTCSHDSSGFEPCMCEGDDEPSGGGVTSDGASSSSTTVEPSTSQGDSSTGPGGDTSTSGDATTTGEGTGPVGAPPTVQITHPGDGEERVVGMPIPFIGQANDPEDGALSGASLVWTDSVEGEIGQGEQFDAPLRTLGDHVITLTATDADGNVGEANISLVIVAP